MDRLQRTQNPEATLREALEGFRAGVWTALPGIIESFDADAMTCTVQPAIRIPVWGADLVEMPTALPILTDCPVYFPAGGNCTLTFPVVEGDECLLVFSARGIDSWWQSGAVQDMPSTRTHSHSDAFVLVGVRSRPRALSGVSTASTQLRSDDGSTYIDLNPATKKISIVAPGGLDVTAPQSTFSGKVLIQGLLTWIAGMVGSTNAGGDAASITGSIRANGRRIDDTHTHGGVQTGSGTSGSVNS